MSVNQWIGDVAAVKQIHTFLVENAWAADDTITFTAGGSTGRKAVTFTSTGSGTSDVAAGMVAAWNASTEPELAEVTASSTSGGSTISLTADTAGLPFTVAASVVTAGSGSVAGPTTGTANRGPNCFGLAANWSLNTVPGSTDNVRFEDSDVDCLYDLLRTDAPSTIDIRQSYTGHLGLPRENANGYVENRETYLTLASTGNATSVDIGYGEGTGSGRIKLDVNFGSTAGTRTASTITVRNKSTRADPDVPCVLLKTCTTGTTGDVLNVDKGDVGVASYGGETATLSTLRMGYVTNKATDALVRLGPGVSTGGTITKDGGELVLNTNQGTVTQDAGKLTVEGGAPLVLELRGGSCQWNSTGTPATVNVSNGGAVSFSRIAAGRGTPTAINLYTGAKLADPGRTVTWNGNLNFLRCGFGDVEIDLGRDFTITST